MRVSVVAAIISLTLAQAVCASERQDSLPPEYSFLEVCRNPDNYSPGLRRTIQIMKNSAAAQRNTATPVDHSQDYNISCERTDAYFRQLTRYYVDDETLTDLRPLVSYANNLTSLYIGFAHPESLDPLAYFYKVRELTLFVLNNQRSNRFPLLSLDFAESMTNLKELKIESATIASLRPLYKAEKLERFLTYNVDIPEGEKSAFSLRQSAVETYFGSTVSRR